MVGWRVKKKESSCTMNNVPETKTVVLRRVPQKSVSLDEPRQELWGIQIRGFCVAVFVACPHLSNTYLLTHFSPLMNRVCSLHFHPPN